MSPVAILRHEHFTSHEAGVQGWNAQCLLCMSVISIERGMQW